MTEARLVLSDSQGRRTLQITGDKFTIGRRNTNDLQLNGMDISRNHAEILRQGEGFLLKDLGSRFGTFVNGESITERPLVNRDRVRLGPSDHIQIVFLLGEETAESPSGITGTTSVTGGDFRSVAALLKGLHALGSGKVLDEVLHMVLDAALELTGADRAFIMLAGSKGRLEFKLGSTRGGVLLPGEEFRTSQQIPELTYETGETQEVADLLDQPELAKKHEGTLQFGIRGAMCVPLKLVPFADEAAQSGSETRIVGVLYLDRKGRGSVLSATSRQALETLATEATVAIENARLYRDSIEKARLEQELDFAAKMQQALAPPRQRTYDEYETAGATVPCRAIGGDFLDYFTMRHGALGLVLGDVVGKGPPAAILAASVHGMFEAQAEASDSPAAIIRRVNHALIKRNLNGRFVTVFFAILDTDGKLTFCNAGHNYPLLLRESGNTKQLETGGIPLGIFEETTFEEESVQLCTGDRLVIYSDGITEARDADGDEYGEERLLETLEKTRSLTAEPLLDHIQATVNEFAGEYQQADDITLLILRYFGARAAGSPSPSDEAEAAAPS
jgi:serine phosphatase RsbU (regulator of sigma subunit)/pSer/pThr/pTyr-binding forkhead associated (FHA) protein